MAGNVQGRVVVITAASNDVGKSTARLLAEKSAKGVLGARREDREKHCEHWCTSLHKRGQTMRALLVFCDARIISIVLWGKYVLSFELSEPEAYRHDVPHRRSISIPVLGP
jgi:NAD(P)-dependent dehydrogenase (short-subunit alcohol dehydrogenase family)